MIMSHQWAHDGFLVAIDLKDLHQGELYQIQASSEHLKDKPEMDGPECVSVIQESTYRKPPDTFIPGRTFRNKVSVLVNLHPARVPCDSGRNPVQSLSWQFLNNEGLLMFNGPRPNSFLLGKSSIPTLQASVPALVPINASTWSKPPSTASFEVRVLVTERALHAMVVAGFLGLLDNFVKVSNPSYGGLVSCAECLNADSVPLAHDFVLG